MRKAVVLVTTPSVCLDGLRLIRRKRRFLNVVQLFYISNSLGQKVDISSPFCVYFIFHFILDTQTRKMTTSYWTVITFALLAVVLIQG